MLGCMPSNPSPEPSRDAADILVRIDGPLPVTARELDLFALILPDVLAEIGWDADARRPTYSVSDQGSVAT